MKLKQWYIKLSAWEYWPMWILYVPVFFQHFYLALKAKSLFFFLKVNPAIQEGFILSDRKENTLKLVPEPYKPKGFVAEKGINIQEVEALLRKHAIAFPIIVKPNVGYRGLLVQQCKSKDELSKIDFEKASYLIQEYIDFPVEIGVFYYRFPNEKQGNIPSITLKEFLSITGDGKSTFEALVKSKPRALLQFKRLKEKFASQWGEIVPNGKQVVLERIGNHNRGTKFINANNLFDTQLLEVFDNLNFQMKGFYYGRFDIRAKSIEDLKQEKNFKILEVNGVGAEPTHIYDPNFKLINAWREMLFLWKVAYKIALQNKEKGEEFPVFSEAKKRYLQYKSYKKVAFTD
ncbi:hypothetical protein [Joostella sp. CR20]|uniref:hypothetical protein n=1 Tax=Joostella sp. CR20 TaxID=2804312 RepID=UPI00313B0B23